MSWQGQMSTVVRHLISDVDPTAYTFSANRIETSILVAAQLSIMNIDFNNTYNTVTRGVTSLSGSWDNDGGIVYNNLDYQIRKGLLL